MQRATRILPKTAQKKMGSLTAQHIYYIPAAKTMSNRISGNFVFLHYASNDPNIFMDYSGIAAFRKRWYACTIRNGTNRFLCSGKAGIEGPAPIKSSDHIDVPKPEGFLNFYGSVQPV